MDGAPKPQRFDLEEPTFIFAKDVRSFVKTLPRTLCNIEDVKQLIKSSGSVGANYIEANEGLSKKDFVMRVKIARKEAKESRHWLRLLDSLGNQAVEDVRGHLIQETMELIKIFTAILKKSS